MQQERLEFFMREALAEGRRALPHCLPNPPVGCVLVAHENIVARGHTQPPFEHHAEAMALSQLKGELAEFAAFVTLEPCAFHQKTPSCAKELISRKIGVVYVGCIDPHPKNQGRGLQMLRDAGIEVHAGICQAQAAADLDPYLIKTI